MQTSMRTIAKAATLVMIFFIASRVLGVLRDVVIASQFGTGPALDAYLAAFSIPDLIFYVISGGALGSAFIPTFTGYLTRKDQFGAWRLASAILNWLFIALIIVGGLAMIFAPILARLVAPEFPADQQLLTASLMRGLLISTIIFGVSGLIMGIHHAHQHFLLPALAPIIYNIAIIAGALLLGPRIGVQGLVVGVVVGAMLHLFIQLPQLHQYNGRYSFVLIPRDPGVREVARLMGPRILGLAAIHVNFLWDKVLASGLLAGSISGLDFGRRVMLLPQGIIAQAVASAAFPTFSALAEAQSWTELQSVFLRTVRSVLYLSIPASIGLIVLGRPIVQLLFERNSFDAESTQLTVWALAFYSIGLVGHSVVEIVTRTFYALHNTKTPVTIGLVAIVINIVLSWLLMHVFAWLSLPPHGGIALASSVAVLLEVAWLVRMLRHLPGSLSLTGLQKSAWQMTVAGALMAVILWGLNRIAESVNPWILAPVGIAIGCGVYGVVTLAMGLDEPKLFLTQVRRRIGR